ncbi:MAG: prepilin-type N-terminal cleavage/methylation domain-containing protein [Proteobacteria bacterium]|nr:prepilin-type N-terminal cleavage/methylation domain-containing protein [Pseudomonadota bacterium]
MKKLRSKWAFTLVELMMVIVIIGILTAAAGPAYRQYILRARMAEGYIGMDAMKKAQIKHFYDYEHFFDYGDGGATHVLPFKGVKQPWYGVDPSNPVVGRLKVVTMESGFSYTAYAGFYDAAGTSFIATQGSALNVEDDFEPEEGQPLDRLDGTMLFKGPGEGGPSGCFNSTSAVNPEEVGILGLPNEHYAVLLGGSNFRAQPADVCTILMQFVRAYDGNITSTPIVSLNVGN